MEKEVLLGVWELFTISRLYGGEKFSVSYDSPLYTRKLTERERNVARVDPVEVTGSC